MMKKRLVLLLAAVALALPLGASVAMAAPDDDRPDRSGDTGAACPDNSPQPGGDPSCGNEGNGGDAGGDNGGGSGSEGNVCPPNSPNVGGTPPNCGNGGDGGEPPVDTCNDGADNDDDGGIDGADANDCQGDDTTENTPVDNGNQCNDTVDNDGDGETDGADLNDCQGDDTTEDTGDPTGGGENRCTAATDDPGILTEDTLGQTLWDGGLSAASPLVEDPEADGAISGQVYDGGNGTPAEPLSDEVACVVDLLIDPVTGLPDL